MSSLRAAALASTAERQAGVRLAAGDRFVRALRLVEVLEIDRAGLRWRDVASGAETEGTRGDFLERALERLTEERAAGAAAPTLLDQAWSVASARSIPAADRIRMLRAFVARLEGEDQLEVRRWIGALQTGLEPTRSDA